MNDMYGIHKDLLLSYLCYWPQSLTPLSWTRLCPPNSQDISYNRNNK